MTNTTDNLIRSYYTAAESLGYETDPGIDGLAIWGGPGDNFTAVFQVQSWSSAEVRVLVYDWRTEDSDEGVEWEKKLQSPSLAEMVDALREGLARLEVAEV